MPCISVIISIISQKMSKYICMKEIFGCILWQHVIVIYSCMFQSVTWNICMFFLSCWSSQSVSLPRVWEELLWRAGGGAGALWEVLRPQRTTQHHEPLRGNISTPAGHLITARSFIFHLYCAWPTVEPISHEICKAGTWCGHFDGSSKTVKENKC